MCYVAHEAFALRKCLLFRVAILFKYLKTKKKSYLCSPGDERFRDESVFVPER